MTIRHRAIGALLFLGFFAGSMTIGIDTASAANEAGPVSIAQVGADLVITGTQESDLVYLQRSVFGSSIQITQPIDGVDLVRHYRGFFTGKVIFNGRNGNDVLILGGGPTISQSLEFNGGSGNDYLGVNYGTTVRVGGGLTFRGGGGEDTFRTSGVLHVEKAMTVIGGAGPLTFDARDLTIGEKLKVVGNSQGDYVELSDSTVGGVYEVRTAAGPDRVFLDNVDAPKRLVDTGNDNDTARVLDTSGGIIDVRTGAGNDIASAQGTSGRIIKFNTGAGHDTFDLFGHNGSTERMVVLGGDGNDTINFPDGYWQNVVINTGAGDDRIELDDPQITGNSTIDAGAGNDTTVITSGRYSGTHLWRGGIGRDTVDISFPMYGSTAKYDGQGGNDTVRYEGYNNPVPTFVSISLIG